MNVSSTTMRVEVDVAPDALEGMPISASTTIRTSAPPARPIQRLRRDGPGRSGRRRNRLSWTVMLYPSSLCRGKTFSEEPGNRTRDDPAGFGVTVMSTPAGSGLGGTEAGSALPGPAARLAKVRREGAGVGYGQAVTISPAQRNRDCNAAALRCQARDLPHPNGYR